MVYGCGAWSLTLREERRLRVFENRIVKGILGFKRDKNGEWRRLHSEELHNLYRSPNIVNLEDLNGQGMYPEWRKVGVLSKW